MPRHPIADDRRELSDLQIEAPIVPRRDSERVLVEPNLSAVIARIESAVEPRLNEEINLRAALRVEKKRETRVKEIVDLAADEFRRRPESPLT